MSYVTLSLILFEMSRSCLPIIGLVAFTDNILIKGFGTKSRWFQLHAACNLYISCLVIQESMNLIINPRFPISSPTKRDLYAHQLIVIMHLYHPFISRMSNMDIFHHLLFVIFGSLPALYFLNTSVFSIMTLGACGIPGFIEYTCLSLVKHNMMTSIDQKKIQSMVSNYLRMPLALYSAALAHIDMSMWASKYRIHDKSPDEYIYFVCAGPYYIIFLVYLNGTFYNKLAIENHMEHKINKNRLNQMYSRFDSQTEEYSTEDY